MDRKLPPRTRNPYKSPELSKEQVTELLHLKLQLDNVIKIERERESDNIPEAVMDGLEVASFILETTVNQEATRLCNLKSSVNWGARDILHELPDVVKDKMNSYLTEACMRLEDYIFYYKKKYGEI